MSGSSGNSCPRRREIFDDNEIALDPKPVLDHKGQRPRESLPGHAESGCNEPFLFRQANRLAGVGLLG